MWIVKVALRRPYTFVVLAIMLVLLGGFTILRTAVDIFPAIRIPVVAVLWQYTGLPPDDLANRIVSFSERTAQTTVTGIEHTESQTLNGVSVVKYFFQPNVNPELAVAQITAVSQAGLRFAPPGTTPPFVLAYDASTVPILQLALSGKGLSEAELFDVGNTVVRTGLAPVAGAALPFPFGGRQRQVQIDLDPAALRARSLSAQDVTTAIGNQNLIIPAGTQKIGDFEYNIKLNGAADTIADLNDLPVRSFNDAVVRVRDVAHVRDGAAPQTNVVRVEGERSVLMSILKTGTASTLGIIDQARTLLPIIQTRAPQGLEIKQLGDQSTFVRSAIHGVIFEGTVAAALTGLLILLFLGSWRSTLIITVSIPLSVLASLIVLSWLGETINIMTLGGLALAVGILVDDATVAIENINTHLEEGKDVETAILDGAHQIAVPALVSTLCICIVFIPMFLLGGIAKFLFVPLAEAVVFAMLASYVLSRTLIPTLAKFWLRPHVPHAEKPPANGLMAALGRFQHGFEHHFSRVRHGYHARLETALQHPARHAAVFLGLVLLTFVLVPFLGRDFFPQVDAGQIKLHLRAPSGTRIETTAQLVDKVEASIREIIPREERQTIVDNLGLPNSSINLAYSNSAPIGPGDADIMITLAEGHQPTADHIRALRNKLNAQFPGVAFSVLPADIVTQILNFGLPSPFDVQVTGFNVKGNHAWASRLMAKLREVPGAVDVRVHQALDYPQISVDVDRIEAARLGLQQKDVANNMLISLSGSLQTNPTFWVDPRTGIQYSIATQTPQLRMQSLNDLQTLPVTGSGNGAAPQVLANLATFKRGVGPGVVSHYNALPTIDVYGAVQDTDLGSVAGHVHRLVEEARKDLPRGSTVNIRGQIETMTSSFQSLLLGLVGAIVLVYLLIVVNFQSWLDPLIIISALPAALAGIVLMLFLSNTHVSVPALTGAIMCIGVATANSVLVVSFARERFDHGESAMRAALEAGFARFRPVLMTALAMVIGMVPMALGLGEGGEQNAPLGRAVIGGLLFATVATLFFVPLVFSLVHGRGEGRPRATQAVIA
ncbi:MAG: efflux RND transporter permease subunit [Aquabacterium sp.]